MFRKDAAVIGVATGEKTMMFGTGRLTENEIVSIETFPTRCELETVEQIRRFELLRLAFFVLKLRKLEQSQEGREQPTREYTFRSSLLRHTIFQQVVTLTSLDARKQAMQLINSCRR